MTRTLGHSLSLHSLSKTIAIMRKKTKFKIGEFSQLMQVTVKTLRHYEQKGLLMPDEVDEWTGYRYYSIDQMQKLNSIRSLQRLGFSLDEIGDMYMDNSHQPSMATTCQAIRDAAILTAFGIKKIQSSGCLSFRFR